MNSGEVIEFVDPEVERLQNEIARRLGYRLVGHKMELYGVKAGGDKSKSAETATSKEHV